MTSAAEMNAYIENARKNLQRTLIPVDGWRADHKSAAIALGINDGGNFRTQPPDVTISDDLYSNYMLGYIVGMLRDKLL